MKSTGKRLIAMTMLVMILTPCVSGAVSVWVDADADGLADSAAVVLAADDTLLTVDVWIDADDFDWTSYGIYLRVSDLLTLRSVQYQITGGSNFPVETYPGVIGVGGFGFPLHGGIERVATLQFAAPTDRAFCLTPSVDENDASAFFCYFTEPPTTIVPERASSACWTPAVPQRQKWGRLLATLD